MTYLLKISTLLATLMISSSSFAGAAVSMQVYECNNGRLKYTLEDVSYLPILTVEKFSQEGEVLMRARGAALAVTQFFNSGTRTSYSIGPNYISLDGNGNVFNKSSCVRKQ